jgi:methyltransferase-like protein 6
MVFFLSALDEAGVSNTLDAVARSLRPGGVVYVRDYAVGDAKDAPGGDRAFSEDQRVAKGAYLRGDGTLARFFEARALRSDFEAAGLHGEFEAVTWDLVNRKKEMTVTRQFLNGCFVKKKKKI